MAGVFPLSNLFLRFAHRSSMTPSGKKKPASPPRRLWHVNETRRQAGDWRSQTELLSTAETKKYGESAAGEEALASWMWRHSLQPGRLRTAGNQAHLALRIAVWRSALLRVAIMCNGYYYFPLGMS